MDRSSLIKYLAIGLAVFLFMQFGLPKITGSDGPPTQPLGRERHLLVDANGMPRSRPADERCALGDDGYKCSKVEGPAPPREECVIEADRYVAKLTTQGASLESFKLPGQKYERDGNLITTPDHEARRPLYMALRQAGAEGQLAHDLFEWKLASKTGKECVFTYDDGKVSLRKAVRAVGRPFEVEVELTVKNVGAERASHRASVETAAWRRDKEVEGGFGRQSPYVTQVECLNGGKLEESTPGDFAPKDFSKPEFKNGWRQSTGAIDFVATSNFYFAQALVPLDGPSAPACERLIEDRTVKGHPDSGSLYRSRLGWAPKELQPGEAVTYKALHFMGPKERDVLASAAEGKHKMSELIRLGTFASIARILVLFLIKCQGLIGSWGVAIILMTLTVRTVLFPLQWKAIKSGAMMQQLKPELDEINARYANDPQQKQLATMELWQKHGVNPLGGCLPMVAQMPVWFALYTALQTAAELYHAPFLWMKDLSAPDTILIAGHEIPFVLPALLGATTFLQQKLMPTGQMDPMQQRMMTYMMPAIFTAMMLFLPAGLGVYMLTNSLLGIAQMLAQQRYYASLPGAAAAKGIEVREKTDSGSNPAKGDKRLPM